MPIFLAAMLVLGSSNAQAASSIATLRKPSAPQLTAGADVKQLRFDWLPAKRALYYVMLEKAHDTSDFERLGLPMPASITTTSVQISVHRHDWAGARYMLLACNLAGCTPSEPVSTLPLMLDSIGYFKASNTEFQDFFGDTVALSADGDTLAVGALFEAGGSPGINGDETDNTQDSAGAVYVFVRDRAGWRQQAYIKASNPDSNDFFSTSIALSADGDTLVVGAPGEDGPGCSFGSTDPACATTSDSGAVYVFKRTGEIWAQQSYVKLSAPAANQSLGGTVRLSADGNTFIATSLPNGAGAYVFTRGVTGWTEFALPLPTQSDVACTAIALSGDGRTIARSCRIRSPPPVLAPERGFIEIFDRNADSWVRGETIMSDTMIFRSNVALDHGGQTLAAGTLFADNGLLLNVYTLQGGTWVGDLNISRGPNVLIDGLPPALAISADGESVAFGHIYDDSSAKGIDGAKDNTAPDSGAVLIFRRDAATWKETYVKASNTERFDSFGNAVLGAGVALSASGDTLAVGAPGEDSTAIGIGGDQDSNDAAPAAGAVYLY
jgi:hypothetical protein